MSPPPIAPSTVKLDRLEGASIGRFTLRFLDEVWEDKYRQVHNIDSLSVMKAWALSALFVYWSLGAVEWMVLTDKLWLAWGIRFGICSTWYAISYVLAFHTDFRKHFPPMMLMSVAAASLSSTVMYNQTGAAVRDLYLYQYVFATLLLYLHAGVIFRVIVVTGWLLCGTFLAMGIVQGGLAGDVDSGMRILFVLVANIISMFSAYNQELADRRYFRAAQLVAKQQELEKDLQQQLDLMNRQEAIGRLAGGVAHEFNNLLQVISGCAEYALEFPGGNRTVTEQLRLIRKTAQSGGTLTRQLLSFSRQRDIAPSPVNMHALIDDQAKLLRRLLPVNIEVELSLRAAQSLVLADAGLLEQVLLNLGVNARDAMPSGGKLTLSSSLQPPSETFRVSRPWAADRTYFVMTVADTGLGIAPEYQQRIFEPFFTTKDMSKGTGLGLATVYGIAQLHDGMIEVSSQPGAGTEFRVYLPLASAGAVAAEPPRAAAPVSGAPAAESGAETLLVVEDNVDLCELLAQLLELRGYRVLMAFDGQAGLDVFLKHQAEIRLAILDVMLPRISGYELFQRIRRANPSLPVIFSSGYAGEAAGTPPPGADRVPVLRKPYQKDAIYALVRRLLDPAAPRSIS